MTRASRESFMPRRATRTPRLLPWVSMTQKMNLGKLFWRTQMTKKSMLTTQSKGAEKTQIRDSVFMWPRFERKCHKTIWTSPLWKIGLFIKLAVRQLNSFSCPFSNSSAPVEIISLQTQVITIWRTLSVASKFWILSLIVSPTISGTRQPRTKCCATDFLSTKNYTRVIETYNPATLMWTILIEPAMAVQVSTKTKWASSARLSVNIRLLTSPDSLEAWLTNSETKALILNRCLGK